MRYDNTDILCDIGEFYEWWRCMAKNLRPLNSKATGSGSEEQDLQYLRMVTSSSSVGLNTYNEPSRNVPVLGEWDAVVCGGGPAGCAAAVAAARHGARTLLVEKESHLGGAAVSALVNVILSTNGVDFQGIWHELASKLKLCGGISALHWEDRMGTRWLAGSSSPELVKLAWDELLMDAGVEILHFAWVAGAIVEDRLMRGILVETKGGRHAVMAKRVIDCTGDADVCALAGAGYESGIEGKPWTQGVSVNALLGGLKVPVDYLPGTHPRSAGSSPLFQRGLLRFLNIDPLNPWDLSRIMREGRRLTLERVEKLRAEVGEAGAVGSELCQGPYIAQTATMPGIRVSRRIHGVAVATAADAFELRKYPDGIARSSWEIDFHSAESSSENGFVYEGNYMGMRSPEYKPRQRRTEQGDWFDIRYGCLIPKGIGNLLVAGRCVSCDLVAQASLRIQQTCMSMGQAAGTAAALSIGQGITPDALEGEKLALLLQHEHLAVAPAFDSGHPNTSSKVVF